MHEHRSGEQEFQPINSEISTSVSHRVHNFTAETLAIGFAFILTTSSVLSRICIAEVGIMLAFLPPPERQ